MSHLQREKFARLGSENSKQRQSGRWTRCANPHIEIVDWQLTTRISTITPGSLIACSTKRRSKKFAKCFWPNFHLWRFAVDRAWTAEELDGHVKTDLENA